jgi:peroxiredoxin
MNRSLTSSFVGCVVLGLVVSVTAWAGKHNKVVNIGDKAPAYQGLAGIDDKTHSLSDLKDAKAVLVVFTCNHCPIAQAYESRLVKFTKDYADKGVAVVAINVNTIPDDRLDKMKERAKEKGFNFAYLYDPSQKIGTKFGATVTPHFFLLDGQRQIVYMGAFDNNQNEAKANEQYVRDAVDAVLAGRKPEVAETRQFGCTIKYDDASA